MLFPGALGDLMLAAPTLRHLRRRHVGFAVTLAVPRRLMAIVPLLDVADACVPLDDAAMARTLGGGPPPPWWQPGAHLYAWMGRHDPQVRAALSRHATRACFRRVARGPGSRHAALAYAAGVGWRPSWEALVRAAHLPRARTGGAPGVPAVLALHRGAGAPAKCWSVTGFATLAQRWLARGGAVVDVRGPADEALPVVAGARCARGMTLDRLAAELAAADAFVGHDSGPAHLAAAIGMPTVVLFGPTDPRRWRPLGARVETCVADGAATRAFGRLDVAVVLAALARLVPTLP